MPVPIVIAIVAMVSKEPHFGGYDRKKNIENSEQKKFECFENFLAGRVFSKMDWQKSINCSCACALIRLSIGQKIKRDIDAIIHAKTIFSAFIIISFDSFGFV